MRPEALPIPIGALPVVRVPPMLRAGDAPAAVPVHDPDLEVRASRVGSLSAARIYTAVVRVRALELAEIRIGSRVGGSGGVVAGAGTSVICGSSGIEGVSPVAERVVPARWEGVRVSRAPGKNTLTYEIVDGWFDHESCGAKAVQRTSAPLQEIVPGVLYAFRDRCDCGVDEVLTLVMPSARSMVSTQAGARLAELRGAFTRVRLPIGDGIESMIAHIGSEDLSAWSRLLLPPGDTSPRGNLPPHLTARLSGLGVFVAVEVVGGVAEPVTAFVERDRPDRFVPDLRPRSALGAFTR